MSLSHTDKIEPKTIENGVVVHPGLQVGEMTLKEHQDYLVWQKMQRKLTRQEAIQAGHRPKEVYEYFGPLDVQRDQVIPPAQETVHLTRAKLDAYVDTPNVIDLSAHPGPLMIHVEDQPKALIGTSAAHGEIATHLDTTQDKFVEAKARGYTGDACPDCGSFTMLNNGTCLVCDNCGRTTGCS
jgi:hypothetical protein